MTTTDTPTHLLLQDVEGGYADDGGDGIVVTVHRAGPDDITTAATTGCIPTGCAQVGSFGHPFAHAGDGGAALQAIDDQILQKLGLIVTSTTPIHRAGHRRIYTLGPAR